jgi:hypothetical protein
MVANEGLVSKLGTSDGSFVLVCRQAWGWPSCHHVSHLTNDGWGNGGRIGWLA